MERFTTPVRASCECGAVQVQVHGAVARFYCHCSICQRLNRAAYGDPVFLFRWQHTVEDPSQLAWKRHRWTPVNVNRGTCRTCGSLVVETVAATPFAIVIGSAWSDPSQLPEARGHAFYGTRVADIDDGLPKWSGYVPSQYAITTWIVGGLVAGPKLTGPSS